MPEDYRNVATLPARSPVDTRQALRAEPGSASLGEEQVWDLVDYVWQRSATPDALAVGQALYAANCAACHGEGGDGRGVTGAALASGDPADAPRSGTQPLAPTDFTDPVMILGASPA